MLSIEMEFLVKDRTPKEVIKTKWDTEDIVQQAKKMAELKHKIHAKAKLNIEFSVASQLAAA